MSFCSQYLHILKQVIKNCSALLPIYIAVEYNLSLIEHTWDIYIHASSISVTLGVPNDTRMAGHNELTVNNVNNKPVKMQAAYHNEFDTECCWWLLY